MEPSATPALYQKRTWMSTIKHGHPHENCSILNLAASVNKPLRRTKSFAAVFQVPLPLMTSCGEFKLRIHWQVSRFSC